MPTLVITFVICTAAIVWAGYGLSKNCDILAVKTGIGKVWIGMTAVAIATSLPELFAGASSILYAGSVNIALGDALGSCVFNLGILALIDYLTPEHAMHYRLGTGNLLSAGFSVILLSVVAFGLVIQPLTGLHFFEVSIVTPFVLLGYIAASRLMFSFENDKSSKPEDEAVVYTLRELRPTILRVIISAVVVALAGTMLPVVGLSLAEELGLGHGFMGSVFIALSTSLPELVVAVSAVRIGAHDLAVGDIFGSNLFNCVVIAIDDILYAPGPIFAQAAPGQLITASIALIMSGVAVVGLTMKSRSSSFLGIGWDSTALICLYILNVVTSYYFGGGV